MLRANPAAINRRTLRAPPGHPARGRYMVAAGLLARGSSRLSGLPETVSLSDISWTEARRLQLRGQLGFA
jgi:hypothetical protein